MTGAPYASPLDVVTVRRIEEVNPGDVAVLHTEVGTDGSPQIISGVVKQVAPWGLKWPGHLIEYTDIVLDGSHEFPVTPVSVYSFVAAFRTNTGGTDA